MRYPTRPHPVAASYAAAFIVLLPILAMAASELYAEPTGSLDAEHVDDSGMRAVGLVFIAAPFMYLLAVPVSYAAGLLLMKLGLRRLRRFLAGAAAIALLTALVVGMGCAALAGSGSSQTLQVIGIGAVFLVASTLPAALCWWYLAVSPLRE